jgi:hypothetical protein
MFMGFFPAALASAQYDFRSAGIPPLLDFRIRGSPSNASENKSKKSRPHLDVERG